MRTLSPEELQILTRSPEFQKIIAEDKILDALEAEQENQQNDFLLLIEMLGIGELRIGNLPVRPITPAKWAVLWMLKSPYVRGGEYSIADSDLFLYLLAYDLRKLEGAYHELPGRASGFTAATGLTFESAHAEILEMIRSAFAPLAQLPTTAGGGSESPRYDADWLARIVSIAAQESNETASHCMYEMSLSSACSYFVSRLKRDDYKHEIRRRPNSELARLMLERSYQLGREFLDGDLKQ